MPNVYFEVLFILALVITNGLFAMAEMALVSARKSFLQQRAEEGDPGAAKALKLISEPTKFLSTIQVWITLVGILAGAFGGATIAEELAAWLGQTAWLKPYAEAVGVSVVVIAITYLSLILGELVPKRLGLIYAERLAMRLSRPMSWLLKALSPIVRLLSLSTEFVVRSLGIHETKEPPVTQEEIQGLIAEGTQAGVFDEDEEDMVASVFRLADWRVSSLMTPRMEIKWLDLDEPWESNRQIIVENQHSRFPAARGDLDNLTGIVLVRDVFSTSQGNAEVDLAKCVREALIVPESMPVLTVLEKLHHDPAKLALVIDEYGGIQGLLTTEDIQEAVIGSMLMSSEGESGEIVQRDDGSWLVDGMLSIAEFKEYFHMRELPLEGQANFQTLGGYIMANLGRIPQSADHFDWKGYTFEVMDMDGFRVDKVLVRKIPDEEYPNSSNSGKIYS